MKRWPVVTLVLLLSLVLIAGWSTPRTTLTVLAGSELQDLEPLFPQIERATGVRLKMAYTGSLTGAEKLLSGASYDLAWFSHGKYLELLGRDRNLVMTQEKIMLSPVVLGVKESAARRLGWQNGQNATWQDIATAAQDGKLRFAMSNPAASNSGFTALVGVATALTGSGDALKVGDIKMDALAGFFQGQALTAGSSGWLADSYVGSQDALDGMINYESVLLNLNQSGKLEEKLTLIYPKDGIITADYPLMLLNKNQRAAYDRLVAYLRSPDFQKQIMAQTLRRPAVPGIALDKRIPDSLLIELPFPNTLDVIDALLFSYLDEQRVPAHAFFVLDVSGSMEGEGLNGLKAALNGLTGLDTSLTGRFSRFRGREEVTIISFNDQVQPARNFRIDDTDPQGPDMQQIRDFVDGLTAGGHTAIYSALTEAYRLAAAAQSAKPDRYYSIVLMSDGANNSGISAEQFREFYTGLLSSARGIRTFTVVFGQADRTTMEGIAAATGGRSFDGTKDPLDFIFKQIRGYQ
jgi:Ca-activated chloride channel family protein